MFSLATLKFCNVGLFTRPQTIEFRTGMTFLLSINLDSKAGLLDSNGVGKTTILNTISWVLFGHFPTGKGDTIQNHESRECDATLLLLGEDQDLTVHRWFKNGKHQVTLDVRARVDPKKYNGDVAAVQAEINRRIGCDWFLFNSVLFLSRQGTSSQFLFLKPFERAKVLSSLIDDSAFQIGHGILKGRVKETENLLGVHSMELMSLRGHLGTLEADIARAELARGSWEEQERHRVAAVRAEYSACNNALTETSARILEVRGYLHSNAMAEASAHYSSLGGVMERLRSEVAVMTSDLSRMSSRAYLERHAAACPTCAQAIPPLAIQTMEAGRARLQADLAGKQLELKARELEFSRAAELVQKISGAAHELKGLEDRAETLHQRAIIARDGLEPLRSEYLEGQVADLKARQLAWIQRIQWLEYELVRVSGEVDLGKRVRDAFGGEVRNLMFDLIRGPLEEWTHYYVGRLIDTGISVQFPHQDAKEKFEILVWNGPHKQDLSVYSGGEVWRIAIAVLLALRKVLSLQSGCKLDFLLCDDFAGELDDCGIAEVLQVFHQLTQEDIGAILFSIPRKAYIPGLPHHEIVVTKQGGASAITSVT